MFTIKVDKKDFDRKMKRNPERIVKAADAAIRGEGYRLYGLVKVEADSRPKPTNEPPITLLTRFRNHWTQAFRKTARYHSDPANPKGPRLYLGIIEKGKYGGTAKTQMSSAAWAKIARHQTRGQEFEVTRKAQKYLAVRLLKAKPDIFNALTGNVSSYKRVPTGRFKRVGAKASQRDLIRRMIPKLGKHRFKGKPIVGPVWKRERANAIRNIKSNFAKKLKGERF